MSEMSLDEIMSGRGQAVSEPVEPAAPEAPAPAAPADGATRDDKGRFAAKTDPAPAQPAAAPVVDPAAPAPEPVEQQPNGFVPIKALDAERGKRKELEDQLRDMQQQITRLSQPAKPPEPPAPAPTLWDAPDEYFASQLTPLQQQMFEQKTGFSRMLASDKHGAEVVDAALQALTDIQGTPEFQVIDGQLLKSIHPFEDLVKWHAEHKIKSEVISDPEAYKQRIIAEYIASQQQQPPTTPAAPAAAAPVLPTAFSSKPTSGPRGGPEYGGPRPLSEIMKR